MLSHTFMCQIFAKTILSWDFEQNGQNFGDFIRLGGITAGCRTALWGVDFHRRTCGPGLRIPAGNAGAPAARGPAAPGGPPEQRPPSPGRTRGPFRHSRRRGVSKTAALRLPRSGGERLEGKFECFHTLLCAKLSQKRFLAGTSKTDKILMVLAGSAESRPAVAQPCGVRISIGKRVAQGSGSRPGMPGRRLPVARRRQVGPLNSAR